MGKTLFALAVVDALGLGSLCTTGCEAATPLRSPDVAAASTDLVDQVAMVCRTKRVCGPRGNCRTERVCERQPVGPGSGTGTGGGAPVGPGSGTGTGGGAPVGPGSGTGTGGGGRY